MIRLIVNRLMWIAPICILVTMVTFAMLTIAGDNVAATILGEGASDEAVAAKNAELGLDRNPFVQYGDWLFSAVKGDLGTSYLDGASVADQLAQRFPVTLWLVLGGLIVATVLGSTMGILAAVHSGSFVDRLITVLSSTAIAIPSFWVGMLLSLWLGINLGILPAGGYIPFETDPASSVRSLILPSIALGLAPAASIARQMRAALNTALESEYVRAARAKGLGLGAVVRRHALRNSWGPAITIIGFQVSTMLGGSFAIEVIFEIPGIGGLIVPAVLSSNYPVIMGTVAGVAVVVVLVNLLVDVLCAYLDPRVRV